jgi:hypothetical protein
MLHGLKMNVRIKELAEQAGGNNRNVCYGHGWYEHEFQLKDDNIQKFAELIIRECIGVGLLAQVERRVILNHFGLEPRGKNDE